MILHNHQRPSTGFLIVGLAAVSAYTITLFGDFTFDDNFAVINNGDVTNNNNTLAGLFKHDFWGQDISSQQSHKSYRPVTILIFRWVRQVWDIVQLLVPGINSMIPKAAPVLTHTRPQQHQQQQLDALAESRVAPEGLHPFPFHLLSVVLHALVSMMTLALAQHLFTKLEQATHTKVHSSTLQAEASRKSSSPKPHSTGSNTRHSWARHTLTSLANSWLMLHQQPSLWLVPTTSRGRFQALAAGLLFALHPIHTEAVAGVVGCAELISTIWSLPALLLYCMAVDGRYAAAQQIEQHIHTTYRANSSRPQANSTTAGRGSTPGTKSKQFWQMQQGVGRLRSHNPEQLVPCQLQTADALQHWGLVVAAAALAFIAALSKEIGITVIGTMMLYDLLFAPHIQQQQHGADSSNTSSLFLDTGTGVQQHTKSCRRQILRLLLLLVTAVGYVNLRSWVAVQQLVAIYRKVENPIPYAESRLTRVLTTGYLHARYFGQLLLPIWMSADWSFNCIPLVEHITDYRNAATLALYGYIAYVVITSRPLQLLRQLWSVLDHAIHDTRQEAKGSEQLHEGGSGSVKKLDTAVSSSSGVRASISCVTKSRAAARARWRLLVVAGLLIAPFLPASNVLFYVGTFIGERLLYVPSIAFCLLLADLIGLLIPAGEAAQPGKAGKQQQQKQQELPVPVNQKGNTNQPAATATVEQSTIGASVVPHSSSTKPKLQNVESTQSTTGAQFGALLLLLVLAVAYAGRTVLRNMDWWDEERLFLSAERVCPNSAKVQQNCGVLMRRYHNFEAAQKHFRRAQVIDPSYCEPSYWIALTSINQGDVTKGLAGLKASLGCKYTAGEALQTLNKLYLMMHQAAQQDTAPMVEWAAVLASPVVLRVADACAVIEDAALVAATSGQSSAHIDQMMDVCWTGLKAWKEADSKAPAADTMAGLARVKYANLNTTLVQKCIKLRRSVYKRISGSGLKSEATKQTVYKYINHVQTAWPACRGLAGGGNVAPDDHEAVRVPSSHQKLLHKVQSADPEDPWLQLEWGETLIAVGGITAVNEAAMHMEVAAAIFAKVLQQLQGSMLKDAKLATTTSLGRKLSQVTSLSGQPLTPEAALESANLPLERLTAAAARDAEGQGAYCEVYKRLCYLRLQVMLVVQKGSGSAQGVKNSSKKGSSNGVSNTWGTKLVLHAETAVRQCLLIISELRACEQQAAELTQLLRSVQGRVTSR